MFVKIACFVFVINSVISNTVKNELQTVYNSTIDPFYELPCLLVGGVCAKDSSCPKETEVVSKGMCPVQQDDGVECCRRKRNIGKSTNEPNESSIACRSKGGDCVSIGDFTCPHFLTVREANDCEKNEVCCIFIN